MAQTLALAREENAGSLLQTLKALEIHKTLSSEPVLTALRHYPAQPADYADFPEDLHPKLAEVLRRRGCERLYTHQRAAYDAVRGGSHTVVVTPTASGKTLCYNLPVLDRILKDRDARALYLFPTKALAQDQLAELHGADRSHWAPTSAPSPTTATRRRTRARRSARAPTSWSRTPTCSTRASCRTTPSG